MHAFKIKIREDGSRSSIIKGLLSPYLGIIQREYSDGKILDSLHRRWYNILLITNKRTSTTNLLTLIEVVTYFYLPKNYCIKRWRKKKYCQLSSPPTSKKVTSITCFDFGMMSTWWSNTEMRLLFFPDLSWWCFFAPTPYLCPFKTLTNRSPLPPVPTLPNEIKQKI